MPIYPSVITGTRAHKHEASSATGGPLSASSITLATGLTQGGIIQGDNANAFTNLNLGNTDEVLKVNAGGTALEYSATMTSLSTQQSIQSGIFSTGSATFVPVLNGMQIVLPTITNGKALVIANYSLKNSGANNNYVTLLDDGVSTGLYQTYTTTTADVLGSISAIFDLDGSQIDLGVRTTGGTVFVIQSPGAVAGSICALQIA